MAAGLMRGLSVLGLLALAQFGTSAAAEILADPTRPPAGLVPESGEAPRRPVLQSIIITPHTRAAVIDDERVQLHGKFRDAEVAKITETEVVLRTASGFETLRMYPDVDKTPVRREAPRLVPEKKSARGTRGERP